MSYPHDPESAFALQISKAFIEALSRGDSPFQSPELFHTLPFLHETGRRFSASNLFHLMLMRDESGELVIRKHSSWISERQARQHGIEVFHEQKTRLLRWTKINEPVSDLMNTQVFNDQLYSLQAFSVISASAIDNFEIQHASTTMKSPSEVIDDFSRAVGIHFKSGSLINSRFAFYNTKTHEGLIPNADSANTQEEIDAIKLHLVVHALMHQHTKSEEVKSAFPTARDELTAMFSTLLIAADAGVKTDDVFKHHADYTTEWMRIAREEPLQILQSCRVAEELARKMRLLYNNLQQKEDKDIKMKPAELDTLKKAGWTGEMFVRAERVTEKEAQECADIEAQHFAVYAKTRNNKLLFVSKASTRYEAEKFAYRYGVLSGLKSINSMSNEHEKKNQYDDVKQKSKIISSDVVYLEGAYTRDAEKFKANKARIYALKGGYDGTMKCWYVPKDADLSSVQDLLHKKIVDPKYEFKQALIDAGFILGDLDPICDGKLHRCRLSDDKGRSLSGAYLMHNDAWPAGYIQNFRTGEIKRWKASNVGQHLTGEQLLIAKAKAEAVGRQREAERNEIQQEAAKHSQQFLHTCQRTFLPTEYLNRKGFTEADLKSLGGILIDPRQNIVVPLRDIEGKIWSHQTICHNGMKMLAKGGRKQGNFSLISKTTLEQSKHVLICEGCATAMSVALAMPDTAVVMAIDAGNLPDVAQAIHNKYPQKSILLCGDDDRTNCINKGREKALEAAALVGGHAVFPIFPSNQVGKSYSDFNDLAQSSDFGRQAVEIQIHKALQTLSASHEQIKSHQVVEKMTMRH